MGTGTEKKKLITFYQVPRKEDALWFTSKPMVENQSRNQGRFAYQIQLLGRACSESPWRVLEKVRWCTHTTDLFWLSSFVLGL